MTDQSKHHMFETSITEALQVLQSVRALRMDFLVAADFCLDALRSGRKLLICGNGGSACEAQHLAGELLGRYKTNRRPLPAIALSADSAVITCIANDFSYDQVFARQIRALGVPGDVVITFSTSGNSPNVIRALDAAHECHLKSVAFLGNQGGVAGSRADCALIVAHQETARIQEAHQFLMHTLMDYIEAEVVVDES